MKLTSNLSLKKPDGSDVVNIDDFNYNADKIDTEIQGLKTGKANTSHTHAMSDVGITTSSAVNSTSTTTIANSYAVKQAYDKGNAAAVQAETNKNNITKQGAEIENLKSNVSNGKTVLATAIGAPIASTDTFAQIGVKIDTLTNTFKNNLVTKGVEVAPGSKMSSLIDKVGNISTSMKVVASDEFKLFDRKNNDGMKFPARTTIETYYLNVIGSVRISFNMKVASTYQYIKIKLLNNSKNSVKFEKKCTNSTSNIFIAFKTDVDNIEKDDYLVLEYEGINIENSLCCDNFIISAKIL